MDTRSSAVLSRLWVVAVAGVVLAGCGDGGAKPNGQQEKSPDEARIDCEVKELAVPKGTDVVSAKAISQDTEYIATGFESIPGLWHDGEFTKLEGVPKAKEIVEVSGVNSTGTAVGATDFDIGWRYADGRVERLKGTGGSDDIHDLNGIADDGTVIGETFPETDPVPVIWKPGDINATPLDPGDGEFGEARDISPDGIIVGSANEDQATKRAVLWDADGKATALPQVSDTDVAAAIAGDWVLLETDDGYYRWNMSTKGEPEAVDLSATDIDAQGWVYGSDSNFALAWIDGKTAELPRLNDKIAGEADNPLHSVEAASADGRTLTGYSDDHPVIWTCE